MTNEDWGAIGAGYVSGIDISHNEVCHLNYSVFESAGVDIAGKRNEKQPDRSQIRTSLCPSSGDAEDFIRFQPTGRGCGIIGSKHLKEASTPPMTGAFYIYLMKLGRIYD